MFCRVSVSSRHHILRSAHNHHHNNDNHNNDNHNNDNHSYRRIHHSDRQTAMSAKKIPPHIARELRRHVAGTAPSASSSSAATPAATRFSKDQESNNQSHSRVLLACAGFVGLVSIVPYAAVKWIGHLTNKEDELSASQIRRGAFNNSGSRDAGKDRNWHNGTYKRSKELDELLKQEDPNKVDLDEKYLQRAARQQRQ